MASSIENTDIKGIIHNLKNRKPAELAVDCTLPLSQEVNREGLEQRHRFYKRLPENNFPVWREERAEMNRIFLTEILKIISGCLVCQQE
ncbi:hypothetical protein HMPREF0765_3398 [Sphingobacterium spiritivorum ATCC 33300]|uniref:Uncharacterized protein n=1 Tax=Sphingobacterium spiritivorum ATCC 33300 TaxID=525372 RepID=C2G1E2_SPHSI|nr:hypothetical protein [Sphingobacterium spiritivorum]EEI90851.1 hypothetical protein HMPREF0765_3398 [Sphingobacterium spiritivorum ATCC 33300]